MAKQTTKQSSGQQSNTSSDQQQSKPAQGQQSMMAVWVTLAILAVIGIYLAIPGEPQQPPAASAPAESQTGSPEGEQTQEPAAGGETGTQSPDQGQQQGQ